MIKAGIGIWTTGRLLPQFIGRRQKITATARTTTETNNEACAPGLLRRKWLYRLVCPWT